ncbi:MAG: hypothetical protein AAF988_00920 [Pseudomonadota bacterium]
MKVKATTNDQKGERLARTFLDSGQMTDLAQLIASVKDAQNALRRCYTVIEGKKGSDVTRVSNKVMLDAVQQRNPIAHANLVACMPKPKP